MAQADRSFTFGNAAPLLGHSARPGFSIHPRQFRGRHHAATIMVLVVLAALTFQAFPSKRVTVFSDGGSIRVGVTFDATSEGLTGAEVALSPGDTILESGDRSFSTVAVTRALPVIVHADGRAFEVLGTNETIAGVLAMAGVQIDERDVVLLDGLVTSPRAPIVSSEGQGPPTVEVRRALPVTVVVDGIPQEVKSAAQTVGELAAELGIWVREVDLVTPDPDSPVTAGMTIRIAPAKSIAVTIDQAQGSLYTRAGTVADVLALLGIELADGDEVSHALETPVTNGMNLVVSLTRIVNEEVEVPIAAEIVYKRDDILAPGAVRHVNGTDGIMVEIWAVTYENGIEVGRELTGDTKVLIAPIAATVYSGPAAENTIGTIDSPGFDGFYTSSMRVWATWYDARHGGKTRDDPNWGITATGVPLRKGICAVDPTVIPLYTRFFVPGYGECIAADVGGGIKGAHIDLGFPEDAGPVPWRTGFAEIYFLE